MTAFRWSGLFLLFLPALARAGDYERGLEAFQARQFDLAIRCFTSHLEANPQSADASFYRALAYSGKKEWDKAILDFNEAIRLNPTYPYAHFSRGIVFRATDQFDKAVSDFDLAIRLKPGFAAGYFHRGLTYCRWKQHEKAILDCCEAIRLDAEFAPPYAVRGISFLGKGEYRKAAEDLTEYHRRAPEDSNVQGILAWLLATCPEDGVRDGKKAAALATHLCTLSGWKDAEELQILAAASAECGDFKEAIRRQRNAIEIGFVNTEALDLARARLSLYEAGKPCRDLDWAKAVRSGATR
jgi:tetratricopeptide (TPR) repeat protein